MKLRAILLMGTTTAAILFFAFGKDPEAQTTTKGGQPAVSEPQIEINPASKARIKFDHEEWDFGAIPKDTKVVHNFRITNTGEDTLIIAKVRPTCGCTAAPLSSDKIPPKGEAFIYAGFNTKNINGRVTKWIYVNSTDPINPYLRISFSATINDPAQLITTTPFEVDFGQVIVGEVKSMKAILTNTDLSQMELVLIDEPSKPSITANISRSKIGPNDKSELTIILAPQNQLGEFSKSISLEAKNRPETRITIPIKGNVIG